MRRLAGAPGNAGKPAIQASLPHDTNGLTINEQKDVPRLSTDVGLPVTDVPSPAVLQGPRPGAASRPAMKRSNSASAIGTMCSGPG